jgi:hypothetical protein
MPLSDVDVPVLIRSDGVEMTEVEMGGGGSDSSADEEPLTRAELEQKAGAHLRAACIYGFLTSIPLAFAGLSLVNVIMNVSVAPLTMAVVFFGTLGAGILGSVALASAIESIHYKIEAQSRD